MPTKVKGRVLARGWLQMGARARVGLGRNAAQISLRTSGHRVHGGSKGDRDKRVFKHGCVVIKGETGLAGMRS